MMLEPRFHNNLKPLWSEKVSMEELEETEDEAKEYDQRISTEIFWKEEGRGDPQNPLNSGDQLAVDGNGAHNTSNVSVRYLASGADQPVDELDDTIGLHPLSDRVIGDTSSTGDIRGIGLLPSFHRSRIVDHSTPQLMASATLPSVPTPKQLATPLPLGPGASPLKRASTSRLRSSMYNKATETPEHIDSPIDTPNTSRATITANDQPTPVPIPLGTAAAAFSSLKGKKDYQTLTKTFDLFNKIIAKEQAQTTAESDSKPKGKGRTAGRSTTGLGGKVFEGLRFCMPPELGQVAKHKQRWDIISKLGGQVTLRPDTAITHVIYDKPSASILCRELGLQTLSELPGGTVCVKWEWVVSCKLAGRLLDTGTWLSFPKNAFTRSISANNAIKASSRFADITDQLRGKSIAITRKREPTASDSDTESPKRPRTALFTKSISTGMLAFPRPAQVGPSNLRKELPSVATNHVLPTGPGWQIPSAGETDGLDEMISGVKNGTVDDDGSENGYMQDERQWYTYGSKHEEALEPDGQKSRQDEFKCQQAYDGVSEKGPNEWLAKKFDEMHDMYQAVPGKNFFSIRQYQQAASIMRRTLFPIESGAQASKIKGVGPGIADRIDEFIQGGRGRQYYENNEQSRITSMFKDVYGVGRTFANELYKKGARSIDDLRTNDYGLTPGQLIGVELYEDLNSRIPREECRQLFEVISTEARLIDPKIWIEIMGSYRRGQEDSGDVDFLITRDTADGLNHSAVLQTLVGRLKQRGVITHDLGVPHDWKALEAKWMGVGRLGSTGKHRRIDILCIPFEQWGAALIYFTGNNIFNRSLRLYARKKGYSLNQRSLSVGVIRDKEGLKLTEGEIVASRTEQEIFDVLGLRWRPPHHRRP